MPTHVYSPRGTALQLQELRAPEVVVAGPAGTGKSRGCLEKIHFMCLINPGMRALVARKTMRSLAATGLVTYRNWVAKEARAAGDVRWYGGSGSQPPAWMYRNGSEIVVGGLDNPDKIMSAEYDAAYVQEATELDIDDWEAITSRLRNGMVSFQQLIADCNPSHPMHWLKLRCDEGKAVMLNSGHEENPVYFDEVRHPDGRVEYKITKVGAAYLDKLDNLTGVRYLRLRKGLWVAAEGVIFEDLDPNLHFIEPFRIPDEWPRYWVVDFGFVNPFVCQMWAEDPDGRLYLYREVYRTGRTVDQHAHDILDLVSTPPTDPRPGDPYRVGRTWTEPKPRLIVADHDAADRALLERELGMSTVAARKGVTDGIQLAQARFRMGPDGKPRIYFMKQARATRDQSLADARKPTSTIEELPAYVWDTGAGRKPKEAPRKEDDHGSDCVRYIASERDRGKIRVRTMGGG